MQAVRSVASGSKFYWLLPNKDNTVEQHAKKVVSESLGLVDFAVGLMNSVLNLPDGQVIFLRDLNSNYRRTVINPAHQIFGG